MFCNGRPVCVVHSVSKVVSLPYFCGYMFNSWIQTLIGSPDVLQPANTCKRINQRTTMLGGDVFSTRCQNGSHAEDHSQVRRITVLTYTSRDLVGKFITNIPETKQPKIYGTPLGRIRFIILISVCIIKFIRRCPWCNGYRPRKLTQRLEFKFWTRLIAFHIALIPLGKVWIQLFSLQQWVNSRADWVLEPWWGN